MMMTPPKGPIVMRIALVNSAPRQHSGFCYQRSVFPPIGLQVSQETSKSSVRGQRRAPPVPGLSGDSSAIIAVQDLRRCSYS